MRIPAATVCFALLWVAGVNVSYATPCNTIYPPQLITFSEYPLDTFISTQYASRGAVFSSGSGSPFITMDGANPTSPVLSGSPLFSGPITVTFVDPSNTQSPADAQNVQFDAGYFDSLNSTSITYFDNSGNTLGTMENTALGIEHFVIPGTIHGYTISIIGSEAAGYAMDNLQYQVTKSFVISAPKMSDTYPLSQSNYLDTDSINFEADDPIASGQVNWTVNLDYATYGGDGAFADSSSFNSKLNSAATQTYKSEGGRLTVNASETAAAGGQVACPVKYAYVVGVSIPDATITARLDKLYNGATPNLLTGIASIESSYAQFASETLYGETALWPHESFDNGSHIGLMQMPTNESDAWDWTANTTDGANLFSAKIRTAERLEKSFRTQYPGLPKLTGVQIENMALVLYGPFAAAGDMQYYTVQVVNGLPQWVINTTNNSGGVAYADSVRQSVK